MSTLLAANHLPSPANSSCEAEVDQQENYTIDHSKKRRRNSTSSDDSVDSDQFSNKKTTRCTQCGKIYKHRNCLVKHQWEHSQEWEFTKKFLLTKHQQVQLLEAAAILMDMMHRKVDFEEEEEEEEEIDMDEL